MANSKKEPWVAAITNVMLWGLGYIYNGKRKALGMFLLVSDLYLMSLFFIATAQYFVIITYGLPAIALITIGLAYDGWKEAQAINKQKERKK